MNPRRSENTLGMQPCRALERRDVDRSSCVGDAVTAPGHDPIGFEEAHTLTVGAFDV